MSPLIKHILSGMASIPKREYDTRPFKLDLAIISPQIVVCAGPTNQYLKQWYRNSASDLKQWLDTTYSQWHIWNLRSEPPEYPDQDFDGKVSHVPIIDHQVPSMSQLLAIVSDLFNYLDGNPYRVAVIHCKEGKGRSGTVACSYMMYESLQYGTHMSSLEAIDIFTRKRMKLFAGDGVSICSQRRYLDYWEKFLQMSSTSRQDFLGFHGLANPSPRSIILYGIRTFGGSYPHFTLQTCSQHGLLENLCNTSCNGEMSISKIAVKVPNTVRDIRVTWEWCYFWFNLYFAQKVSVEGQEMYKVSVCWEDVDGLKGTIYKGAKKFDTIEVYWQEQ